MSDPIKHNANRISPTINSTQSQTPKSGILHRMKIILGTPKTIATKAWVGFEKMKLSPEKENLSVAKPKTRSLEKDELPPLKYNDLRREWNKNYANSMNIKQIGPFKARTKQFLTKANNNVDVKSLIANELKMNIGDGCKIEGGLIKFVRPSDAEKYFNVPNNSTDDAKANFEWFDTTYYPWAKKDILYPYNAATYINMLAFCHEKKQT